MPNANARRLLLSGSSAALVIWPAADPSSSGQLGASRGQRPGQFQRTQMAVNVATRTDSLHDLLAQVAALAEVQSPHLRGLLRQIALRMSMPYAGIPSAMRNASSDAQPTGVAPPVRRHDHNFANPAEGNQNS